MLIMWLKSCHQLKKNTHSRLCLRVVEKRSCSGLWINVSMHLLCIYLFWIIINPDPETMGVQTWWCQHAFPGTQSGLKRVENVSNSWRGVFLLQESMALSLSSPCGCPYDEDEELAVFESTAAEHGGPARPRLPEISVISPGLDTRPSITEKVSYRSMWLLFSVSLNQENNYYRFLNCVTRNKPWTLQWWDKGAAMKRTQRGWRFFCASGH